MINAFNGIEEWVFYPQDLLRIQADMRTNSNGEHLYGVDGVPQGDFIVRSAGRGSGAV